MFNPLIPHTVLQFSLFPWNFKIVDLDSLHLPGKRFSESRTDPNRKVPYN
jgi:hypothetical protein